MTIGQLARQVGLRTSAIRFYESEGLIAPASRVSGRRVYANDAVERLTMILGLQQAGFTIREMRDLLVVLGGRHGSAPVWHARAHQKLAEIDAAMARFRKARKTLEAILACGCSSADDCRILAAWKQRTPRRTR